MPTLQPKSGGSKVSYESMQNMLHYRACLPTTKPPSQQRWAIRRLWPKCRCWVWCGCGWVRIRWCCCWICPAAATAAEPCFSEPGCKSVRKQRWRRRRRWDRVVSNMPKPSRCTEVPDESMQSLLHYRANLPTSQPQTKSSTRWWWRQWWCHDGRAQRF